MAQRDPDTRLGAQDAGTDARTEAFQGVREACSRGLAED
jgi:hypothetical protein